MEGDTIRIGHLSTMYHTAFLLRGSSLLADRGVSASWSLYPSGPDIISAMQAGKLDLGYIGLPPVIIGIDKGLGLACIAGGHVEGTIMVAPQETPVLAECSGMKEFLLQFSKKAIGTPPKGSIHDVIVHELLREYGIRDVRVKKLPVGRFSSRCTLYGGDRGSRRNACTCSNRRTVRESPSRGSPGPALAVQPELRNHRHEGPAWKGRTVHPVSRCP